MEKEKASKDALVNENLGLVHACANKFRGRGAEYDDLFQAGCVGLCKAAANFDAERGFAFSTYAVPVILGEIRRIFRDGGTVKVSRSLKEKARAALKTKQELENELSREPTISELAEKLGVSGVTVVKTGDFKGGAVVSGAKRDTDLSFEALVADYYEKHSGDVARAIFGDERD